MLRRSMFARAARPIFLRAAHNDPQHIIRQWPLQRLRLIPRRGHPDIALQPVLWREATPLQIDDGTRGSPEPVSRETRPASGIFLRAGLTLSPRLLVSRKRVARRQDGEEAVF